MADHRLSLVSRAGILAGYPEVAKLHGLDPERIMRSRGVDPATLTDVNAWIPSQSVADILKDSANLCGRDDFGILLARYPGATPLGPISLLLAHERTVRDVIRTAIEFEFSISNALVLDFSDEEGTATLKYELLTHHAASQLVDLTVGVGVKILQNAAGGRWRPATVHFRHRAPKAIDSFKSTFRCPLFFDAPFNGWTCASAELDKSTGAVDGHLINIARRLLESSGELKGAPTLSDRVVRMIYNFIATKRPILSDIAAGLGMSARSLQRKLEQEGETFESVLTRVRRDIAIRTISLSDIPITQIAFLTGFADPSAFSRWFRDEFHSNPAQWRAEHRLAQTPKEVENSPRPSSAERDRLDVAKV